MNRLKLLASLTLAFPLLISAAPTWTVGQKVNTTIGEVIGHASKWKSEVSEYLGIPYAQPPIDGLRFAAPKPYVSDGRRIFATQFGRVCPANVRRPSPKDPKEWHDVLSVLGQEGEIFDEDCLTLNIWTKPQSGDKGKAVMIWIHGGGFSTGSSANPTYNGARLADENDVIVVSLNYRLNIFGFPGLPLLPDQNLGLLDQRLAVEWVRDNIDLFGGDPKRMVLFGESAGGASVDLYAQAWQTDPIVSGFVLESGTVAMGGVNASDGSNWYEAAESLTCGGVEVGIETLECMRSKKWQTILLGIKPPGAVSMLAQGAFVPTVDGKVVFADYDAKLQRGDFIKKPTLVGNNDNEGTLFSVLAEINAMDQIDDPSPPDDGLGPSGIAGILKQPNGLSTINLLFTCPAGAAAKARRDVGVPAWRYRYNAEWPNQSIGPKAGAWHGAEMAMVFGTTERISNTSDTEEEKKLGKAIREAWTSFAKDPEKGLEKFGWPLYNASRETVVVLGKPNSSSIAFVDPTQFDSDCGKLPSLLAASFPNGTQPASSNGLGKTGELREGCRRTGTGFDCDTD